MAVYTEVLDTSFNFPNINIYQKLRDGVLDAYVARAQEGYVFYDTNANDTEVNPDTMEEVPVTYYYVIRIFPKTYNMANFSLVAVPRDSVDENYIYGVGDNNHETI